MLKRCFHVPRVKVVELVLEIPRILSRRKLLYAELLDMIRTFTRLRLLMLDVDLFLPEQQRHIKMHRPLKAKKLRAHMETNPSRRRADRGFALTIASKTVPLRQSSHRSNEVAQLINSFRYADAHQQQMGSDLSSSTTYLQNMNMPYCLCQEPAMFRRRHIAFSNSSS